MRARFRIRFWMLGFVIVSALFTAACAAGESQPARLAETVESGRPTTTTDTGSVSAASPTSSSTTSPVFLLPADANSVVAALNLVFQTEPRDSEGSALDPTTIGMQQIGDDSYPPLRSWDVYCSNEPDARLRAYAVEFPQPRDAEVEYRRLVGEVRGSRVTAGEIVETQASFGAGFGTVYERYGVEPLEVPASGESAYAVVYVTESFRDVRDSADSDEYHRVSASRFVANIGTSIVVIEVGTWFKESSPTTRELRGVTRESWIALEKAAVMCEVGAVSRFVEALTDS